MNKFNQNTKSTRLWGVQKVLEKGVCNKILVWYETNKLEYFYMLIEASSNSFPYNSLKPPLNSNYFVHWGGIWYTILLSTILLSIKFIYKF